MCDKSFGESWKAGTKAAKYHVKRVLADVKLTVDEFSTT